MACSGALPPGVPLFGAVCPPQGSGGGSFRRVPGSGPVVSPAGPFRPAVLLRGASDLRVYLYRVLPCGGTCLSLGICWRPLPPASLAFPTPAIGAWTITRSGPCGGSPSRGLSRSLPPLLEVTLSLHAGATPVAPGYRPAAPWSPWSARGLPPLRWPRLLGLARTCCGAGPGCCPSRNLFTPRGRLFHCLIQVPCPGGTGFALPGFCPAFATLGQS